MKTKIINMSGTAQYIGFLAPHGRTIPVDDCLLLDGDLRTILASSLRAGRLLSALNAALAAGLIALEVLTGEDNVSSSSCSI